MRTNWLNALISIALVGLLFVTSASAQTNRLQKSAVFNQNEELQYSINFKWGILNGKLAQATITNRETRDGQYFSQLVMRTINLADTFYPMRDTLETLYNVNKLPRRFEKRINDNGYRATDVSTYTYSSNSITVKNTQTVNGSHASDTTMVFNHSNNNEVLDLLSTLALLRTYDFVNSSKAPDMRATVTLAKDKANIVYRMLGNESITMPDGTRRQAMKIAIQVDDKNFNKGKNAVIVWLTRDKAQIPVKIQADLKIGAALVQLTSYRTN